MLTTPEYLYRADGDMIDIAPPPLASTWGHNEEYEACLERLGIDPRELLMLGATEDGCGTFTLHLFGPLDDAKPDLPFLVTVETAANTLAYLWCHTMAAALNAMTRYAPIANSTVVQDALSDAYERWKL